MVYCKERSGAYIKETGQILPRYSSPKPFWRFLISAYNAIGFVTVSNVFDHINYARFPGWAD